MTDSTYKWYHRILVVLCLAYFTQYDNLSIRQDLIWREENSRLNDTKLLYYRNEFLTRHVCRSSPSISSSLPSPSSSSPSHCFDDHMENFLPRVNTVLFIKGYFHLPTYTLRPNFLLNGNLFPSMGGKEHLTLNFI